VVSGFLENLCTTALDDAEMTDSGIGGGGE